MTGGLLTGIPRLSSAALFVPLALAMVLGLTFWVAFALSKLGGAKRARGRSVALRLRNRNGFQSLRRS